MVEQFPTVSAIDLTLILQTVDIMLNKMAFAIRFMAFFSVLTGFIVLAGAVITGRYQRTRESVLLRTLCASRQQIQKIVLIEYFFLGSFAALSGILLALASSWGMAYFLFETVFAPSTAPVLLVFLLVLELTIGFGMLGSRGLCDRSPLDVLRSG